MIGRGRGRMGFSRIFVPGRHDSAQSKIRTISFGPALLPPFLILALAGIVPAFPRAAETTVLERPSLAAPSAAASHADTAGAGLARQQWGLDETEWQRYQVLMLGIRGSVSPSTLSPLEVLGIHARDDAERRKYAKRFAAMMREDVERILAFQAAYDAAAAELNPGRAAARAAPLPSDRLLLFVEPTACAAACEDRLAMAMKQRKGGARLDIYVVGASGDDAIRAWAKARRIDPAAVLNKEITLNHERGELARVAGPAAAAPLLVRLRDGAAEILAPGGGP